MRSRRRRQTSLARLPRSRQFAELRNSHVALKAPVKGLAQVKQDKITIHGPKNDGAYIVEFKTADGVALAFSVPKGGGTAVLEYFQASGAS